MTEPPSEPHEYIPLLIRGLDTDDLARQRENSRQLIAFGARAAAPLVEALRTGTPNVRKSSAYLLGALKDAAALDALADALCDEEPKVRQNAAVALGKLANGGAVSALSEAARRETIGWVRASIFLALGAIGGESARQTLEQAAPGEDAREREAYRKAADRVSTGHSHVDWNPEGVRSLSFLAEAPEGMEFVAQEEVGSHGLSLEPLRPGLLVCSASVHPDDLLPRLRCIYGFRIGAGETPPLSPEDASASNDDLFSCLAENTVLLTWRDWLRSDAERIRYRFSVQGIRLRKDRLRLLLDGVRRALLPLGWTDSPSHYDLELILQADPDASRLYVKPSFMKDHRFDYRLRDVGASIQPVVAACLARLAFQADATDGVIFDPVCGSGTLLIERALLNGDVMLSGLDVSPTAVRVAQANVEAAGLSHRIRIRKGDAAAQENWPDCSEALANLPFGMRTKHESADIPALYEAVVKNMAGHLRPGGRAVLYTAAVRPLQSALRRYKGRLKVNRQFQVRTGGMEVHVFVLAASGKARPSPPPL